jgi:hypothetical protein
MKEVWSQAFPFLAIFLAVQFYRLLHFFTSACLTTVRMRFPYPPYVLLCRAHLILRDLIISNLWGRVDLGKP